MERTLHIGATADLDDAARAFSVITEGLERAYAALEQRALRVEAELARTNRELEQKVRELDEVGRALGAILESLPTGVVVRDASGRVVRTNPAAQALLGSRIDALEHLEAARGTTARLLCDDGATKRVHVRTARVIGEGGSHLGALTILDDRTEIEELSARLHVQEKMTALGTLAAGIAHEIRNPLNAICGFAGLLEKRLDEPTLARWASLIARGAHEIDGIVTGLVTMASPEALEASSVDTHELVERAVQQAMEHREAPERWRIETNVALPRLRGDAVKLRQALKNLIANAADAQPSGGVIKVEITARGDDHVLSVEDDGPGVPCELRSKILEPFFTTRAEGTGLGLALTHTIAQLHGGSVSIGDARPPLHGASFLVRFPTTPTGLCE
jgi:signal transduction histidine kinase